MVDTPYEFIAIKMYANESDLKNSMSMARIAMVFRDYEDIDNYDVNYWNNLIRYFVSESEERKNFASIEEFKEFVLGDYKLKYSNGSIVILKKNI